MSVFTFGLYQIFFFYESWKYIDNERESNLSPSLKSIFYMIFNFSLVENYLFLSKKRNILYSLLIYLCIIINIILNLLSTQIDQFKSFSLLACLFLIPFLNLRNSYICMTENKIKKRKWLNNADVRILGYFWLVVLLLMIFLYFKEGL